MLKTSSLNENGSVFFYILIAIVLLAALTYTVSNSSRTNTSIINEQQAKVAAQNIIEQGDVVSNAVQKLLLRGYDETEISFENDTDTDYVLAGCAQDGCKIFNINGGGLNWLFPPENANDGTTWIYTGNLPIQDNGKNLNYDLTMILPNLNEKVCQEINFKLGLAVTNNEPILTADDATLTFNKLDTAAPISANPNFINGTNISSNSSICVRLQNLSGDGYSGTNQYHYVHTVYAG